MSTLWLLTFFLAEPQVLQPNASTIALIMRARTILEHLEASAVQGDTPSPIRELDLAALVKPFFTNDGVAPPATPQQSDLKTQ